MTKSRSKVNVLQRVTAKEGKFSVGGSEIQQTQQSFATKQSPRSYLG
jgi:hypothetical protein